MISIYNVSILKRGKMTKLHNLTELSYYRRTVAKPALLIFRKQTFVTPQKYFKTIFSI